MRGRTLKLSMAVLAAALAVSLAIISTGCGSKKSSGSGSSPIKIGAILSLSGDYAGLGQPEQNVLDMEVKKINDAGGINGHQIQLIVADDATDEAKAVAAASKLIEQDKVVAILGPTGTGETMAIRGDIDRAQIPNVSMAGGTVITNPVDKFVFATPWSNLIVVPFTLDYLKKQGITKIGVISDTGGFGADGLAVLKADVAPAGVTIVSDQTFNPGDTDMTAQLTQIKNSAAQAIVMWTAGPEAAIIAKEVKDLGITLPLYGSHGIARKEFIAGAGDAANGVKFAAGKILIPSAYGQGTAAFTQATDFIARYQAAYNDTPNTFAGHAFDAIHLVADAAGRISGDVTASALRDEIEKTSGFVGIGGNFTFSPTDHNGMTASDLVMYEIVNGQWQLAK